MSASPELDHVTAVWQNMKGNSPIYDFLLASIRIISATKGSITAQLTLEQPHVNSRGTIHGAVSATLVDWSGGLAIATHGMERTGASIDIHITYIGTAAIGDIIQVEATANKVGRSIAFTSIRITNVTTSSMVATGSHTKYIQQATKFKEVKERS